MRITQIAYERTIKTADGGTATYSAIATVGADSPRHSECFQLLKQTVDSYVQSIIDMQNKQISLDKKGD